MNEGADPVREAERFLQELCRWDGAVGEGTFPLPQELLSRESRVVLVEGFAPVEDLDGRRRDPVIRSETLLRALGSFSDTWMWVLLGDGQRVRLCWVFGKGANAAIWNEWLPNLGMLRDVVEGPPNVLNDSLSFPHWGALIGQVAPRVRESHPGHTDGGGSTGHRELWEMVAGTRGCLVVMARRVDSRRAGMVHSTLEDHSYALSRDLTTRPFLASDVHFKRRLERLRIQTERFEEMRTIGGWSTAVMAGAASAEMVPLLLGTLRACTLEPADRREAFLVRRSPGTAEINPSTPLTHAEAAVLVRMPDGEVPGMRVRPEPLLYCSPRKVKDADLLLGNVSSGRLESPYLLSSADFTRHLLVCGMTGSGKTVTSKRLLTSLKVPWLVLEPAKCEYRGLVHSRASSDWIFTVGDERAAPLRLNPFEVPEGLRVQLHIDHLNVLFRGTFVLFAPMPYILEQALYEVYERRGWNLASGSHPAGPGPAQCPTVREFLAVCDEIATRAGYDARMTADLRASLRVRIGGLLRGVKGATFDTTQSFPIERILAHNTVMELSGLADPEVLAFLVGLLFMRLHEHRLVESLGTQPSERGKLRHVTLIEEAHRLFSKTGEHASGGGDESGIRSLAVESLSNMLAELRAMGEGIVVVDQSPSKLAPDVLRNTGTKIVHQVVAPDDREALTAALALDQGDPLALARLSCGKAVVFSDKDPFPVIVKVDVPARPERFWGSHLELRDHYAEGFLKVCPGYLRVAGYCGRCAHAGSLERCSEVRAVVANVFGDPALRVAVLRLLLLLPFHDRLPAGGLEHDLRMRITGVLSPQGHQDTRETMFCLSAQLVSWALRSRLAATGCSGDAVDDVAARLAGSLRDGRPIEAPSVLETLGLLKNGAKGPLPFPGCVRCRVPCTLRPWLEPLVEDPAVGIPFSSLNAMADPESKVATMAAGWVDRWLQDVPTTVVRALTLCVANIAGGRVRGLSQEAQERISLASIGDAEA